ncbi:ECF transporter S component [Facklamia languida]
MLNLHQDRTNRTLSLVHLGLFFGIILLQTWVPFLGYIAIPPLNITIIHVTVMIATLYLGIREGFLVGTFWGLNSLLRAYLMPTSPMYVYVFSSPLVSLLPRMIMPLLVGWFYHHGSSHLSHQWRLRLSGLMGSLLNTILVLGSIAIFKRAEYLQIQGADLNGLWKVLGGIILVNGIPEAIFAAMATPIIIKALTHFEKGQTLL